MSATATLIKEDVDVDCIECEVSYGHEFLHLLLFHARVQLALFICVEAAMGQFRLWSYCQSDAPIHDIAR